MNKWVVYVYSWFLPQGTFMDSVRTTVPYLYLWNIYTEMYRRFSILTL
jgi:hypothetical protein